MSRFGEKIYRYRPISSIPGFYRESEKKRRKRIEKPIKKAYLKELEFNFYVVMSLAIASGFSETRIPDLLKKLEEPEKGG